MAVTAPELVVGGERTGGKPSISAELVERAAPVTLAVEQRLPVLAALEPLLSARGLRRGSVVVVEGLSSLALALAAAASAGGSWCGAVGRPALGLVAAAELGIVLDRFPMVPAPAAGPGPGGWAWVVATLLDALDLVIAWPPSSGTRGAVRPADARRLASRARERRSVLVVAGQGWPEAADVRLAVTRSEWLGPDGGAGPEYSIGHSIGDSIGDSIGGTGAGRLRGRRVEVVAGGRGAASRERRSTLWLPAPGGGVTVASDAEPVEVGSVGADWGQVG